MRKLMVRGAAFFAAATLGFAFGAQAQEPELIQEITNHTAVAPYAPRTANGIRKTVMVLLSGDSMADLQQRMGRASTQGEREGSRRRAPPITQWRNGRSSASAATFSRALQAPSTASRYRFRRTASRCCDACRRRRREDGRHLRPPERQRGNLVGAPQAWQSAAAPFRVRG